MEYFVGLRGTVYFTNPRIQKRMRGEIKIEEQEVVERFIAKKNGERRSSLRAQAVVKAC